MTRSVTIVNTGNHRDDDIIISVAGNAVKLQPGQSHRVGGVDECSIAISPDCTRPVCQRS